MGRSPGGKGPRASVLSPWNGNSSRASAGLQAMLPLCHAAELHFHSPPFPASTSPSPPALYLGGTAAAGGSQWPTWPPQLCGFCRGGERSPGLSAVSLEWEQQQSKCWAAGNASPLPRCRAPFSLPPLPCLHLSLPASTLPWRHCSSRGISVAHMAPTALWILPWRLSMRSKAAAWSSLPAKGLPATT